MKRLARLLLVCSVMGWGCQSDAQEATYHPVVLPPYAKVSPQWAGVNFQLDPVNHTITVSPDGDVTGNLNKALIWLLTRPDQDVSWTMLFQPGQYAVNASIMAQGLHNVAFKPLYPGSKVILAKGADFKAEYLFYAPFSTNLTLSGLDFYGATPVYDPAAYAPGSTTGWQDQGLYFASCDNIELYNNRFFNISNGAIRVTTSERDPNPGVNSFHTRIHDNYFENVGQITTTSNDQIHGATYDFLFQNNTLFNLRRALKFASRTPGAGHFNIINNVFNSPSYNAIELSSVDDVLIQGNQFQDIANVVLSIYTNQETTQSFPWGRNIIIDKNNITRGKQVLSLYNQPYTNGQKFVLQNLQITNNQFDHLTPGNAPNATTPVLYIAKGPVDGVTISNNTFSYITNGQPYLVSPDCTHVVLYNNSALP